MNRISGMISEITQNVVRRKVLNYLNNNSAELKKQGTRAEIGKIIVLFLSTIIVEASKLTRAGLLDKLVALLVFLAF
jgi:hypothetical protein